MTQPRIKTTTVGSYPAPEWLIGFPGEESLMDATRAVINLQEKAGVDLVTDGELYRFDPNHPEANGMIEYFAALMDGIRTQPSFAERIEQRRTPDMDYRRRIPGIVEGPIGHGELDLPAACDRARSIASHALKFTLTGPHMLSKVWVNRYYESSEDLAFAIAEILADQVAHLSADVVQLDEANLPGHPDEWEWAAAAMNQVLDAVPTKAAVHLCFGNYAARSVQRGSWDKLIHYLNALHADHIVMEMADRPPEEIDVFKGLRPEIGLGLGVVDVKSTQVETPEEIARSIERTEERLGDGRVRYIHPDCGLSKMKRFTADAKIRVLAQGRDLFEGLCKDERRTNG